MFGYEPEFVVCGDARIAYYDVGRGKPLVLLHGNGEDSSYWNAQIPELTRFYRVIAVDSRGHGASGSGGHGLSFEMMAEDLKTVLDTLGVKKAHFLGFSDGANIAMEFAAKYPEKVDKLVLNGGNFSPKGVKRSVQLPIEIGYKIASRFAEKSEDAKKNAEILGLMVNEPDVTDEELKKITAKTLVVAGTRDMIKASHTKELALKINGAKLVFIKGNHFVANKNPSEFNAAVLDFLLS